VEIKNTIRYCEVLALGKKNFSDRGRPGGVEPPSVNLGPPNISESNVLASGIKNFPILVSTFLLLYFPRY